jgi:hypothetical protein
MRPLRLSRCLAVVIPLALIGLVAACGGGGSNAAAGSAAPEPSSVSSAPPENQNKLKGSWAAQPGQADKITQTLTSQGFECTKHGMTEIDLRMCTKTVLKPAGEFDEEGEYLHRLRFIADGQGTVVKAAINGDTSSGKPSPSREMAKQVEDALLSPTDATILAAGGTKLTWGTVVEHQCVRYLTVLGAEGPDGEHAVAHPSLPVTKEEALPTLQAAKLTCKFTDTTKWGAKQSALTCTDPEFKPATEDGSIAGGTAEAILVDEGYGITSLSMEGSHTDGKHDLEGVKLLLPKVLSVTKEGELPKVQEWVGKHLDGFSHSAYIGDWMVTVDVTRQSMLGSSVIVTVRDEQDNFGKPRTK